MVNVREPPNFLRKAMAMLELPRNQLLEPTPEDAWLQAVGRPTPLRHSIFGGSFNIEYWSAELFGPPSEEDPEKKVFQVLRDEGRVGMIEVSAFNGQHLEPF